MKLFSHRFCQRQLKWIYFIHPLHIISFHNMSPSSQQWLSSLQILCRVKRNTSVQKLDCTVYTSSETSGHESEVLGWGVRTSRVESLRPFGQSENGETGNLVSTNGKRQSFCADQSSAVIRSGTVTPFWLEGESCRSLVVGFTNRCEETVPWPRFKSAWQVTY